MINRVFWHSKEVAKKSGVHISKVPYIFFTIGLISSILLIPFCSNLIITLGCFLLLFIFLILMILYGIRNLGDNRSKLSAFAITIDGRILIVKYLNDGQGLFISGYAAGNLFDQVVDTGTNIGQGVGGIVGGVSQMHSFNKAVTFMSNPNIIAKIVEDAQNVTWAEVHEILKVHSILNCRTKIKVNCDYKNVKSGRIRYNFNLVVDKAYNQFDDLVKMIDSKR